MACLGFQFVDNCIKGQALPFSCNFSRIFFIKGSFLHSQIGFLDAHGGHYTTTVYIHHIFFPYFQFNPIKITLCHLMLKVANFSWL
jgi:hypothetical protein